MKVRLRLFAAAKEAAGCDELAIDLPPEAKVADLRTAVVTLMPGLQTIVRHSMWAVGSEYVRDDTKLTEHSDVALIPPVSGG